ncbi:hypothetical protein BC831DRAFT_436555 [Entophlyctis helioformis]|nr:hypothetical protein BC831DRAFT_436555 [Entophlyctis helioformis]
MAVVSSAIMLSVPILLDNAPSSTPASAPAPSTRSDAARHTHKRSLSASDSPLPHELAQSAPTSAPKRPQHISPQAASYGRAAQPTDVRLPALHQIIAQQQQQQQQAQRQSASRLGSLSDAHSRLALLENLVDVAVSMINALDTADMSAQSTTPTRIFVIEIMRRVPATFSTVAVALLYLHRFMHTLNRPCAVAHHRLADCSAYPAPPHPLAAEHLPETPTHSASTPSSSSSTRCGRRMFLASLILAHKYLAEPVVDTNVWALRLGLDPSDVFQSEMLLLTAIDYSLFVRLEVYGAWIISLMAFNSMPSLPISPQSPSLAIEQLTLAPLSVAQSRRVQTVSS